VNIAALVFNPFTDVAGYNYPLCWKSSMEIMQDTNKQ